MIQLYHRFLPFRLFFRVSSFREDGRSYLSKTNRISLSSLNVSKMRLTNWFSYYMRTVFDPFGFVQALNLGYCIHHSDSHLHLCSLHTFQKYRIGRSYMSSEVMFHISCKHWSWQQEKLVSTNSFLDFNSLTNSCIRLSLLRTGSYPFAAPHHCFQPLIWCFYRQSSKWKASIFS